MVKIPKDRVIFFDFDNTITKFDVLDDMLERFSIDDRWVKLEEEWKLGRIGSRQCLDGQIRGMRITRDRLDRYLETVEIDPSFKKLLELCEEKNIRKAVLSDNFEYILNGILERNGIGGLDVYCNVLKIEGDELTPEFPRSDGKCGACAHCKTGSMKAVLSPGFTSIYVGDGLSDLCPSRKAALVFAKSALKERLTSETVPHVPFDYLGDVYEYIQGGWRRDPEAERDYEGG